VGDTLHSRVVGSKVQLTTTLGVRAHPVATSHHLLATGHAATSRSAGFGRQGEALGVTVACGLDGVLPDTDAVTMLLRVQTERNSLAQPSWIRPSTPTACSGAPPGHRHPRSGRWTRWTTESWFLDYVPTPGVAAMVRWVLLATLGGEAARDSPPTLLTDRLHRQPGTSPQCYPVHLSSSPADGSLFAVPKAKSNDGTITDLFWSVALNGLPPERDHNACDVPTYIDQKSDHV